MQNEIANNEALEAEAQEAKQQAATLASEVNSLEERLQLSEAALAAECNAAREREAATARQQQQKDSLHIAANVTAKAEVEDLKTRLSGLESKLATVQAKLTDAESELAQTNEMYRANMALGAELRKNASFSNTEAEKSRVKAEEANNRALVAEAEVVSLREEVKRAVSDLVQYKAAAEEAAMEVQNELKATKEALVVAEEAMEIKSEGSSHHDWLEEQEQQHKEELSLMSLSLHEAMMATEAAENEAAKLREGMLERETELQSQLDMMESALEAEIMRHEEAEEASLALPQGFDPAKWISDIDRDVKSDAEIAAAHYIDLAEFVDRTIDDTEYSMDRPVAVQQLREQLLEKRQQLDEVAKQIGQHSPQRQPPLTIGM